MQLESQVQQESQRLQRSAGLPLTLFVVSFMLFVKQQVPLTHVEVSKPCVKLDFVWAVGRLPSVQQQAPKPTPSFAVLKLSHVYAG